MASFTSPSSSSPPSSKADATPSPHPHRSITDLSTPALRAFLRPILLPSTSPRSTFRNWAGTYRCRPFAVFCPTTEEQCIAVVELGRRERREVKPVGTGHSPSDLACTGGFMVRMDGLNGVKEVDTTRCRIRVQAGALLSDVHVALESHGLAMSNLGSISMQTIAGAITTATHGTGIAYGNISTYVRSLRLLVALPPEQGGTQLVTCSREERSDLFLASLCGLGSTGMMVEVDLQVEPAFRLHELREEVPFASLFGTPSSASSTTWEMRLAKEIREEKEFQVRNSFSTSSTSSRRGGLTFGELAELDEETKEAQRRLEAVLESAQHVRIWWFPQTRMVTVSRMNRTLAPARPPSLFVRARTELINRQVTPFLLFLSRYHRSLPSPTVQFIYWLNHPTTDGKCKVTDEEAWGNRGREIMERLEEQQRSRRRGQRASESTSKDNSAVAWSTETEPLMSALVQSTSSSDRKTASPSLTAIVEPAAEGSLPAPLHPAHPMTTHLDTSYILFNMDCLMPQNTDEWAVPYVRSAACLRALSEWLRQEEEDAAGERLHFPVEVRWSEEDDVWLSPCQGRRTCYIGLVQYLPYNFPTSYRLLFNRFERLLRHFGGRPHWAKTHTCSSAELRSLYPHFDDFRRTRDAYDPDGVFLSPYVRRHVYGEVGERVDARRFKAKL